MSLFSRFFGNSRDDDRAHLIPLYNAIVALARMPHWFEQGEIPDTVDGRFDMIAALLAITLLRLQEIPGTEQEMAHLTEIFIEDMDGQLREIGIGDMVVGKHIGRMMASLGGRLTAFREAFTDQSKMNDVLKRNIYRGLEVKNTAIAHVEQGLHAYRDRLTQLSADLILSGEIK